MYKFKINIKTRCDKHPNYNPEKQTPKGFCSGCQRLWEIRQKAIALTVALRQGEGDARATVDSGSEG